MNAVLLSFEVITTRGRSGLGSISPVLRLLRSDKTSDHPPPSAGQDLAAKWEISNGRLNPTTIPPWRMVRQKTRSTNWERLYSLSFTCGGKPFTSRGKFLGSKT